jgi:alkylhydroperoxidase family enzyme
MKDAALVEAVLTDWRTARVSEAIRATLAFLETLTLVPDEVSSEQVQQMLRAGLSAEAIEEAIAVCAAFNIADRLADTFDYEPPSAEGARRGGEHLLLHGYR